MSSNASQPAVNTDTWDARRGVIRSRIGGARIGEGVVYTHGYSILEELVGHVSYFQGLILNITGSLPDPCLAKWMEATFLCLSWPDSRIWCNTIGALAGSARTSPVAAVTAGILASDSQMYGPKTIKMAANSLFDGLRLKSKGASISEIVDALDSWPQSRTPVIPGFSRPITYGDERVPVMDQVAQDLGFEVGEHLKLAYEIHEYLRETYGESINLAGYMAAFLTDQGIDPEQIFRMYALCVNGGIHACYGEAFDNPPSTFLPLRCDDIEYQGKPHRQLPD